MVNVIGGMASGGLNWLFDSYGHWYITWIYQGLSLITESIMKFVTEVTDVFWETPAIELYLDFFTWINGVVMVVSIVFLLMEIVEQSGRVNWMIVFSNIVKGLLFVLFNRYIGLATYQISAGMTKALGLKIDGSTNFLTSFFNPLMIGLSGFMALIIAIVAFVAFFIMGLIRNGTLLVQIFASAFYIPSIIQGDTAKFGEWLQQTVAISATYFMQYLLFYLGLDNFSGFSGTSFIVTGTCWLTMFFVPRILGRFGYSSGAASVVSSAGNLIHQGLSLAA